MKALVLLAAGLVATTAPAFAQTQLASRNPQVDYPGFERLAGETRDIRKGRLIDFAAFRTRAAQGALILDARSKDAFARGHLAGAVNLPFTDFTAESLAEVIGPDRNRPILIYCNNNFSNHRSPVPLKSPPVALNIQTFINLVGYGYRNVWELNDLLDFNDPAVGWVKG
ncbi:rhodanese-like domain-containing protein [Sphingomonas sp. G-3-2-10]|uniref:rhodanese-like domain-containing protein n=1 Tax=Sphingomonas sp. G-3-2-10 TaxID=2728838 RepID=UPI00146A00DD|nr:rhodanese-like domain-containing protein [Sphingomonas sp. G-3-2-10]NML04179.1 rhodanese-like domain-containing protein [Sphingomonas sp. G-3-2-10]